MPGERSATSMIMDHIRRCTCFWYVIELHYRIAKVLQEIMLEAGATKGRDLRLEVRRIRLEAFRDRPRDVVCLYIMAPHRHLVVYMTYTCARTKKRMFLI
jgi:hypothetical protein